MLNFDKDDDNGASEAATTKQAPTEELSSNTMFHPWKGHIQDTACARQEQDTASRSKAL